MKSFAVIGLGRFGIAVAEELAKIGNEVLVIDTDEDRVAEITNRVTHAIIADATDDAVLRSIGVRNFDCAIVAIGDSLEDSILITLALKELGAKYIVCKARNETHKRALERIGADRIVVPERDMGKRLAQMLDNTHVLDYIELSPDYGIIECEPPKCWVGKSLKESNIRANYGITVLATHSKSKKDFSVSPSPDYVVQANDILVIVGSNTALDKVKAEP